MKLLIGNTGLIGTVLKEDIKFDFEFNSKNINELTNLELDPNHTDLYLCCLPATKWLVNQDPSKDFNNMINIIDVLSKKEYKNIILYSTIDIYQNAPIHSDELYTPEIYELNYGINRYIFEQLVKRILKYKNFLVLRLPSLFGKHIKKNILFDLLNNNEIKKIPYNSEFQWYNLDNLIEDTNKWIKTNNKHTYVNLFPEPIKTSEILKLFNIKKTQVNFYSKGAKYNYKTIHFDQGFIDGKKNVLKSIKNFIKNYSK